MNEIIEEIQGESKAQATKDNYARRVVRRSLLGRKIPILHAGGQLSSVTTLMICEYLAKTSKNKNGNTLSFPTPESNHCAIVNIYAL